jgi:hypothetical protein
MVIVLVIFVLVIFVTYLGAVSSNYPAIAVPFSHTTLLSVDLYFIYKYKFWQRKRHFEAATRILNHTK